ncbi:hypothetical protein TPY_0885 [Sulfobacillus acidophilus TPY]|nr:hypothetical protein TPY_0885 [Sulfobacillus acidophilus TPY]
MPVSLTFDHRALDGADAAAFLQTLDQVLTVSLYSKEKGEVP